MLARTVALFAFGVAAVLFGVSQIDAQPGKGGKGPGKGPGPGAGPDIKKLETDLERLLEQVQATKAALAKAREAGGGKKGGDGQKGQQGQNQDKGKKGFEGKGKGFGGKGFGGKGFDKKFEPMKKFGPGKEGGKLDPETIKERYEFYKKLYDELPKSKGKGFEKGKGKGFEKKKSEPMPEPKGKGGKGFPGKGGPGGPGPKGGPGGGGAGGGAGSPGGVEARLERLIRELEALRSEIRGPKKK